jgi:D-glycero-alpha-D-manno-heptose-7-phosphate kinase
LIIRAKAPLRISFAGGGTDVMPYPEEHGGCVLNCTIDRYAYCTLDLHNQNAVNIRSLDYNVSTSYGSIKEMEYDGTLDIIKAALKVLDVEQGMDVFVHSDVLPGAGLGGSSSVAVALVGALARCKRHRLDNYAVAEMAYRIEREEAGVKGGRQDQYAAAFGGMNFMQFIGNETIVTPLQLKQDILNEFQYRLMLCDTGKRRLSAGIIEDQIRRYQEQTEVVSAFEKTKELALEMKNALLNEDIEKIGVLLNEGWAAKKRFSEKITDPYIDGLYEVGIKNGALGGKLLGAGGGGYLLFMCQFDKWHKVACELERCGGKVMSFAFDFNGLQTWEVGT